MIPPEPALVQSQSHLETGPGTMITFVIADLLATIHELSCSSSITLRWVIQQQAMDAHPCLITEEVFEHVLR